MESAIKTLKRVLELGGNDPAIVCEDVDVADVAPKVCIHYQSRLLKSADLESLL